MTLSNDILVDEAGPTVDENSTRREDSYPSKIVANSDVLQPNKQQLGDALDQSRAYWYRIAAIALSLHDNGIGVEQTNPHHMLWRVPKMNAKPQTTYALQIGACSSQVPCFQASANWRLVESAHCGHVQNERTDTMLLHLGTRSAIPYTFDGNSYCQWIGSEDEVASGPSYLSILILGWCYILSAHLVEIRGQSATMQYAESKARGFNEAYRETMFANVDIGEADDDTILWWSSILAPDQGWRAVVQHSDEGDFLAPWSLQNACKHPLSIRYQRKEPVGKSSSSAMSSNRAYETLARFALFHNLRSQFLIAFAAAILVSTHNCHGSSLQLPQPTHTGSRCPTVPTNTIPSEWAMLHENLPYYMTLSCNPEAVINSVNVRLKV